MPPTCLSRGPTSKIFSVRVLGFCPGVPLSVRAVGAHYTSLYTAALRAWYISRMTSFVLLFRPVAAITFTPVWSQRIFPVIIHIEFPLLALHKHSPFFPAYNALNIPPPCCNRNIYLPPDQNVYFAYRPYNCSHLVSPLPSVSSTSVIHSGLR